MDLTESKSGSVRPSISEETRTKILEAAGQIFADVGFQAATIRDICERAGTNTAAVNYHFRDKQTLYVEVFRASLIHGQTSAVDEALRQSEPAEQLFLFVRGMLRIILGDGRPSWWAKLMTREMAQPTAALSYIVDEAVRPNERRVRGIMASILNCPFEDERVRFCAHSVMAQVLHYKHARPVLDKLWPELLDGSPETTDRIARHIATFSLGALHALAETPCDQQKEP